MRKILSVLVVLAAAGGVYYYATQNKTVAPKEESQPTQEEKREETVKPAEEKATQEADKDDKTDKPQGETQNSPEAAVKTFNVTGQNFAFSLKEIRVAKGDKVKINFESVGGFHDLVIDGYGQATTKVSDGQKASIEFTADKPGTFEYYCSVGSHRQMGMVGKFIVE